MGVCWVIWYHQHASRTNAFSLHINHPKVFFQCHSYPYWGCGGCPRHRTSVCSARYFCNRLHLPPLQVQLWSTKMFSLCAETGCTKYFHLSVGLFVQNFLCARYKCNHAVASCRQSTDFLFCRDSLNQSWLAVWSRVLGFTQLDKFLFLS